MEKALECVLRPDASPRLAYDLARQYSERHKARYGTGLLPESAPMVEDLAEFWGRHFLGPGVEEAAGKVICPESALVAAEDDHRLADLGAMSGLWVIGLFVGIDRLFNGWFLVMLGLAVA